MKYQAKVTLRRNNKVVITKGQVLTEKQVITKKVKNYVTPLQRNTYTTEDYQQMVGVYLDSPDMSCNQMTDRYNELYPNNTLNNSGLMMYFSIMSGLDNTTEHVGLDNPSKEMVSILKEVSPTRFG